MFFMYSTPITIAVIRSPGCRTPSPVPRAAERRIVGGAGVDQALDMALAELLRLRREALGDRIGDPGRDVGAGPGQHADHDADQVAAHHVGLVAPEHPAEAAEDVHDRLMRNLDRLRGHGDVAQDLADREHADHRRDEGDPAHQLDVAEAEAGVARGDVDPDRGDEQPDQQRDHALTGASVEMKTAQLSPKQASQKYSAELNLSANSASAGAEKASTAAPNSPPIAE